MTTTSSRGTGRILLLAMAALLAVTGCGYLPETRGQFRTIAPVWSAKMDVVAGPVAVGDTVVVIATAGSTKGQLEAVGLDPATGKVRWRAPTTPSLLAPGVPVSIVHDRSTVYLMTPLPGLPAAHRATLNAVDATTGKPRWKTRAVEFADVPQFCDATRASLCTTAEAVVDGRYRNGLLRVDARAGTVLSWPHDPRLARRLTYDLFQVVVGKDAARVGTVGADGRLRWQAGVATLVAPKFTPDYGWTVFQAGRLYVAEFGFPARVHRDDSIVAEQTVTVDLSKTATVGFEPDTGRRRWIDQGSDFSCGAAFLELPDDVFVRCRPRGTLTGSTRRGRTTKDVDVTVERFDPATGKPLWRWHAGDTPALVGGPRPVRPRLSSTEFAVEDAAKKVIGLDVRTGRRRPLDPDVVGWCAQPNSYESAVLRRDVKGGPTVSRDGETLFKPCRVVSGVPAKFIPPPIAEIGTTVKGRYIWAAPDGLHAIEVP